MRSVPSNLGRDGDRETKLLRALVLATAVALRSLPVATGDKERVGV
jgi:hypothetical protein